MKKGVNCNLHFIMKAIVYLEIIFCLLGNFSSITTYAAEDESQQVKVGFFARTGYHEEYDDGTRSGYGYEVLQLMARYSNLCYEYVGYDKNRSESFEMLRNGEIDILTSVHKDSERLEEFSFSEIDIGDCYTMMTVKAGNTDIKAGHYETYEGIRVGLVNDDVHDISFYEYAAEKGFSYTPVYYDTIAEIVEALESGEIDASATSSVRILNEKEWYLESFHEESMYVVVRKGNEELLEAVNAALANLDSNEPDWRLRLLEKYYPKDQGYLLNLSMEELQYLEELQEEGKVFKVLVNPDRYPYSYIEDGEYKGIMIDVFANLADKANIDYEYIMVDNRKDYMEILISDMPDICIDCPNNFSAAENQGYRITDVYLKVNYSWLYRSDNLGTVTKLAKLTYSYVKDSQLFEDVEYVDYMSDEEAIEAVRNGEVDGYSTNTLNAEKIIWEDERNEFQAIVRTNTLNFTIGTAIRMDSRFLSILNKAVSNMDEELVEDIKANYSYLGVKPFSFERLFYEYPWIVLLIFVFCLVVTLFIVYITLQRKYQDKILQEVEAAKKANQVKTEFISRMSHDIRTPINGIVGMIEVARRNIDNKEKVKDCLIKMVLASKHLGSIVDDVLNVSKIETQEKKPKDEPFNIRDQLEYCVDIINGKMYGRQLNFEYNFDKIKHVHLIGPELYLNEIVMNILDNCVKYTKDGGNIRFLVEEKQIENSKKAAFSLVIEDTGIGMSEEFLQKIYEPFAQESTSSRSNYEGTGLGMTIVKNLLEKMGGTMKVESQPGMGSKFTVYLEFEIDKETKKAEECSLKKEEKANEVNADEVKTGEVKTGEVKADEVKVNEIKVNEIKADEVKANEEKTDKVKDVRVLVVDDIELNLEILQSILEDEGVTVMTAYNGAEAVDAFAASEVGSLDLILMDIRMPIMDGIEATRTIRNMNRPDAKNIFIVAITANSFEADAEKSKEAGMDGHMNKPIEVEKLISIVELCKNKYNTKQ